MNYISSLAGILDFFIPAEVLSAVLLVFAMENILDYLFTAHFPAEYEAFGWLSIYLLGVVSISILNYMTATEDDLEELNEDIDNL